MKVTKIHELPTLYVALVAVVACVLEGDLLYLATAAFLVLGTFLSCIYYNQLEIIKHLRESK